MSKTEATPIVETETAPAADSSIETEIAPAADSSIEIRAAFRAFLKAPHKQENRNALEKWISLYAQDEYDRRLAQLKAEFGRS